MTKFTLKIYKNRDYFAAMNRNQSYYLGLDHDNQSLNVTVNITIYVSTCRFWNESIGQWEGTGCRPSHKTSRQFVVCTCNHLTSFGSSIDIAPNKLDFTVLKVSLHHILRISLQCLESLEILNDGYGHTFGLFHRLKMILRDKIIVNS